jgi:hypothetical protein
MPGDTVTLPEFQLRARSGSDPPVVVDVFLNPLDHGDWVSRRHDGLRLRADAIVATSSGRDREPLGIPFLIPEIQLLYKAKGHRPQDEADFSAAFPFLGPDARRWLSDALRRYHPGDPWIARI